jgi:hypothetical protein
MFRAQLRRAQPQPLGRARRQVLHEHVGFRQQPLEHLLRRVVLDVEREALLRAVGPHEVRGQALDGLVVAARRIAAARALDLDHARPHFRQLAGRERPGDHLLERDHGDALERPHRNEIFSPGRGSPLISVRHSSPATTGCASVSTPVVRISPARKGGASGWRFNSSTR